MEKQGPPVLKEQIQNKPVSVKPASSPAADPQRTTSNSTLLKSLPELPDDFSWLYIFIGLSAIIILIFILRAMRFRSRKTTRIRRYGVTTTRGDVEMMPLENEDDDEDATVFDILDHSGPQP